MIKDINNIQLILTASTCLMEAMHIKHTVEPGLQESIKYWAVLPKSASLSTGEKCSKFPDKYRQNLVNEHK